jgi:hypothetical protein
MAKRLSSIVTPFCKFTPFVLTGYTLLRVTGSALLRESIKLEDVKVVGGALLLFTLWYLGTFRWKNVYLEDDGLRVSNYFKSIDIPLSNIKDINASSWWGWQPQTIILRLYSPTEFGTKIIFVPRYLKFGDDAPFEKLRKIKPTSF